MQESATYQTIREEGRQEGLRVGRQEGRVQGARNALLRVGVKRFGFAPARVETVIFRIDSFTRLEQLVDRLFDVEGWDELLAE